jgi:hypothetical protein
VDCHGPATQWSCQCDGDDVIEGRNSSQRPVLYSPNLDEFVPRCTRCHNAYDRDRLKRARSSAHLLIAPLPQKASYPRNRADNRRPLPRDHAEVESETLFDDGWWTP